MRIGHGYDAHRLVVGRALIIGGVDIPFEKGLYGHSDADVLTHAVIDAILGAAALGNIGKLFPDSDPAYKDADSIGLLKEAYGCLTEKGYEVVNVDATVIAQRPKLMPYLGQMEENLARALGAPAGAVSVKAKTTERMGFEGEEMGISAHCVCLIEQKKKD